MTDKVALEVLTTAQAAELLQFSENTIRDYAAQGKLPALKTEKGWRFRKDLLLDWVAGRWIEEGGR